MIQLTHPNDPLESAMIMCECLISDSEKESYILDQHKLSPELLLKINQASTGMHVQLSDPEFDEVQEKSVNVPYPVSKCVELHV